MTAIEQGPKFEWMSETVSSHSVGQEQGTVCVVLGNPLRQHPLWGGGRGTRKFLVYIQDFRLDKQDLVFKEMRRGRFKESFQ